LSTTKFSIIIPCYNYAHFLPRAVTSAIQQHYNDNVEVIIINDGSSDDTEEVSTKLQQENSNIRYFLQPNGGAASARNLGVIKGNGSYYIFLDADDELLPNALDDFNTSINDNPNHQIFIGKYITQKRNNILRYSRPNNFPLTTTREQLFSTYLLKKLSISAGAIAFHKSVFNKVTFPEHLKNTEDIPFYAQTLALFDTVFIDKILVKIHRHSNSLRHNFSHTDSIGTQIVDTVFDPNILPSKMMKYRAAYYFKRCLSLAGLSYEAGAYRLARQWYFTAIKFDLKALLKIKHYKRFIVSLFKQR